MKILAQYIPYILYVALSFTGLLLFKANSGMSSVVFLKDKMAVELSWLALTGLACYVGSFLLSLYIIKNNAVSHVFPVLTGILVVLTVLGGIVLLHENISPLQAAGIGCIVLGIILVNFFKPKS
jgi:multidrug transporter EmrE-like cation transporter